MQVNHDWFCFYVEDNNNDDPSLDPSRGPRNYPSMFFSLFPIQDCGWVYRTNFTNFNHSSISQEYIKLQYTYLDYYPCQQVHSSCIPSVSTRAPNNDGICTNFKFFPDILRDPIVSFVGPRVVPQIIISNVGPKVVPDTEPSVDSSETPSIDPDHHLETSPVKYNGCNYFSPDIASPVHRLFQFRLLLLKLYPRTSSSSNIDSNDLFSSAPVLCSSFNSTIHTVTMVVHLDVGNKGKEYQQF